jgi:succinate-semialdehyde dehydrogenase / glutarate-semialdehyde dehydrogenase
MEDEMTLLTEFTPTRGQAQTGAKDAAGLRGRIARLIAGLDGLVPQAGGARERSVIRAPFTGEVIGSVPACTADDVALAAERARVAQAAWAETSLAYRREIFLGYHDLVLDRQEELLDLVQIEGGKARRSAVEEIFDVAINARYYAYHAAGFLRPRRRQTPLPILTQAWEYRHPVGVVGIIAPWNYPLAMAVSDAIPALLAGNAVLLKPAEITPFVALYVAQLLREAGLPDDLFQVLTGRGRDIGGPLIAASNFLCFTGSTETGRGVACQAGSNLIKCSLELGGKNPMIVLDDADLGRAVHGAIQGCFASAGQLCISFERLYVQSGIYDRFIDAFVRRTEALQLGAALDYSVDVGSLISQDQLEKVTAHLKDAIAKGATVLTGGSARPDLGPYFFEPTILTGATPEMSLYCDETFGPVVSIYRFDAVEDAVAAANASEYGLNASIWSRDVRRGRELASRIHCGTVNVNEAYVATWSAHSPMGGMRNSGVGRRHGEEGFLKYTEAQTIGVAPFAPLFPPFNMDIELAARLFPALLRAVKYVPGLR